jgi:ankyrin repeat protein
MSLTHPWARKRQCEWWNVRFEKCLEGADFLGAAVLLALAAKQQLRPDFPAVRKCVEASAPLWLVSTSLLVFPKGGLSALIYAINEAPVDVAYGSVSYVRGLAKLVRPYLDHDEEIFCLNKAAEREGPAANLHAVILLDLGFSFDPHSAVMSAVVQGHVGLLRDLATIHFPDKFDAFAAALPYCNNFKTFTKCWNTCVRIDKDAALSVMLDKALYVLLYLNYADEGAKKDILLFAMRVGIIDGETTLSNGASRRRIPVFKVIIRAWMNTGHDMTEAVHFFLKKFGFFTEHLRQLLYMEPMEELLDLAAFVRQNCPAVATNFKVCKSVLSLNMSAKFAYSFVDREYLLEQGFSLFCSIFDGDRAKGEKLYAVKTLLDTHGWKPSAEDVTEEGNTVLHFVMREFFPCLFFRLIEFDSVQRVLNEVNAEGDTALSLLFKENTFPSPSLSMVQTFVEHGADVNLGAPLFVALARRKEGDAPDRKVAFLLKNGAAMRLDVETALCKPGDDALEVAVRFGNVPGALAVLDRPFCNFTGELFWFALRDESLLRVALRMMEKMRGCDVQSTLLFEAVKDPSIKHEKLWNKLLTLDDVFDLATKDADGRTLGFHALRLKRFELLLEHLYDFPSLVESPGSERFIAEALCSTPEEGEREEFDELLTRVTSDLEEAPEDYVKAVLCYENADGRAAWESLLENDALSLAVVSQVCNCVCKVGDVDRILSKAFNRESAGFATVLLDAASKMAEWKGRPFNVDFEADSDGSTLFLIAAKKGNVVLMEKCKVLGASTAATNTRGENASYLAAAGGHGVVVAKLFQWGVFEMSEEVDLNCFSVTVKAMIQMQRRNKRAKLV